MKNIIDLIPDNFLTISDFKTINGESIVGIGDIVVGGSSQDLQQTLINGSSTNLPITLSSGDNSALLNVYSPLGATRVKTAIIDLITASGNQLTFDANGTIQKIDGVNNSIFTIPLKDSGTYTLATLDDIVDTRPYKVYTALLNQSGTNAPTATVLENTLGDDLIFTYLNNGYYGVTSNSPVLEGNLVCEQHRGIFTNEQGESSQLYSITIENVTNTGFTISTRPHQNSESNDMLYQRYFEIKIYETV